MRQKQHRGKEGWNKKEGSINPNCNAIWAKKMKLFCTEELSRLGYSQYTSQEFSSVVHFGKMGVWLTAKEWYVKFGYIKPSVSQMGKIINY